MVGVHGDRHYVPCMKKSDILIWPTVVWEDRILYTYMAIGVSCFDYTIENDLSVSSEAMRKFYLLNSHFIRVGMSLKYFQKPFKSIALKTLGKYFG